MKEGSEKRKLSPEEKAYWKKLHKLDDKRFSETSLRETRRMIEVGDKLYDRRDGT